eukprot:gene317-576_t
MRTLTRSVSEKDFSPYTESIVNKNVEWMNSPFTSVSYVLSILTCWGILHISQFFSPADCWTYTNIIHGAITFILLHWIKGCPDDSTQGIFNGDTVYEQMDGGIPWTRNKKFLMLIPTLLTWMACHAANYEPAYLLVNLSIFFVIIIAKIPSMHHVRIFGINSTPGIDTKIQYSPPTIKKDM